MKKRVRGLVPVLALVAGVLGVSSAGAAASPDDPLKPIYVDPDDGLDTNDGKSWDTAVQTIAKAISYTGNADYYNERRVLVVLKHGTYVLSSPISMYSRTSLTGDPAYPRSATVLTAPSGTTFEEGIVKFSASAGGYAGFRCLLANLTVSNVTAKGASPLNVGNLNTGADGIKRVISNVVVTCCRQSNSEASSSAGASVDGSTLVVDCEFSALTNTASYGSVATCRGGGWFRNCVMRDNYNYGAGGCLRYYTSSSDKLNARCGLEDCILSNNVARYSGGALYQAPVVLRCKFYNNRSLLRGGGACFWEDDGYGWFSNHWPRVEGCVFVGNSTGINADGKTKYAGGALNSSVPYTVSDCEFRGNTSTAGGGACFVGGTAWVDAATNRPQIVRCAFTDNASGSGQNGGALRCSASIDVIGCGFTNNLATGASGAVRAEATAGASEIRGCSFVGNRGTYTTTDEKDGQGAGAVFDVPTIRDSVFIGNTSTYDAGAIRFSVTHAVVSNCFFSGNSAQKRGGAIMFHRYLKLSNCLVSDCVFTNNCAGGTGNYMGGGALYAWSEQSPAAVSLTVRNCLFAGNVLTNTAAAGCGSAVILICRNKSGKDKGRILMESCTVVGNRSMKGDRAAVYVWPDDETYGFGNTFITNTIIACNLGATGGYTAASYDSVYDIKTDMLTKLGHCVIHPRLYKYRYYSFDESQHVTSTDTVPAFKPGTWIPKRSNPAFNGGINLPWMANAYDLQRNEKGEPFVPRICRDIVDIGAYENEPSGLGLTLIVW